MLDRIKKYLVALVLAIGFISPAYALPPVEQDGTVAIASGAQVVPLGGSFAHLIVWSSPSASDVNITFNPVSYITVSTTNAILFGGGTVSYGIAIPSSAITAFQYYGTGTTGTINWIAW